jgi:hypothetical protein
MAARYKSTHAYFERYFEYFSNYQIRSVFLNSGNITLVNSSTNFWDKTNLTAELAKYVGNSKDLIKIDGVDQLARIPAAKLELDELEANFKRYQNNKRNQGFEITEYPSNVLDQKLKIEAMLDVMYMEVELIQKKLATFVDKVEAVDDSRVLAYGLQGSIKQIGGKVHSIDGQHVEMIDDVNCISDPRSIYDGLSLVDYRELCSSFYQEQKRKAKEKLLLLQAECRERGIPVVQHCGASFTRVSRSNLPPFPDWAINHKTKKPEEESSTLTRTK